MLSAFQVIVQFPQVDGLDLPPTDLVHEHGNERIHVLLARPRIGLVAILPRFLLRRRLGNVLHAARFSIAALR
jgi:hypothetical protein